MVNWKRTIRRIATIGLWILLMLLFPKVIRSQEPFDYEFSFKMPRKFGELDSGNGDCCEWGAMPLPVGYARQLPSIIGLGVHKSGTTFLFQLLALHPDVLEPANSLKELYMFAEWPVGFGAFDNYLKAWNVDQTQERGSTQLFEATATYLHVAGAPCRMKALLPDAKFVVVLKDPVARAVSHYNMAVHLYKEGKRTTHPGKFVDVINAIFDKLRDTECFFNGTDGTVKSWNDCYKCWYVILDEQLRKDVCERHGLDFRRKHKVQVDSPCDPLIRSGMFVQFGTYAAPIAWWLHFFRPEQFVFLNSDDLQWERPEDGAAVGNWLAKQLGLSEVYTRELIASLPSNVNHFKHDAIDENDPDIIAAKAQLREYYRPQVRDLYKLFEYINVPFPAWNDWPVDEVFGDMGS